MSVISIYFSKNNKLMHRERAILINFSLPTSHSGCKHLSLKLIARRDREALADPHGTFCLQQQIELPVRICL